MTSTLPTTSPRYLTLVTDPTAVLSVAVLERLADLDAEHATACDIHEIATRELEPAREALTLAAQALTVAEAAWQDAGAGTYDTARALADTREAAGLVLSASGYRRKDSTR
jgi:hypothetical protein